MHFIQTIKNSIYSPVFYSTLLKRSFKSSFGYFFLLILLLTVINTLLLIKPLIIDTPVQIQNLAANLVDCFPKELEVKVENGLLSSNQPEPYFIPQCKNLGMEGDQNLAVIDTKTSYSPQKFDEHKAAIWVTKDSIVYKRSLQELRSYERNDVETRSYSLAQVQNFKLNKQVIDSFYQTASPYFKFVGPALLIISFAGIYLAYTFRLVYLLILAALIWLLGKAFRYALTYGQSYKISLFAVTLGLIVELVVNLTARYTGFYGFPFMFTIISLGVVTVNLFTAKKSS